jgi:NTP pyrophosphatase (non-canonical NTP hydrolase)
VIFHIEQAIALIRFIQGDKVADTIQKNVEILVTEEAAVINHVVDVCGEMEQEKGFREDAENSAYLRNLSVRLNLGLQERVKLDTIADRIDVLNNVAKLMLMTSELAEAMTELRKNGGEHYGEELADAVIRVFANAHQNRIPLGDEIVKKVDKNREREHKHGRNF